MNNKKNEEIKKEKGWSSLNDLIKNIKKDVDDENEEDEDDEEENHLYNYRLRKHSLDIVENRNIEPDKIIGMEYDVKALVHLLTKYKKRNVLLVGEAGVGKTTVVELLAKLLKENRENKCIVSDGYKDIVIPDMLKEKIVLELNCTGLIAGTKYRGEFEEKVDDLLDFISASDREIILFIDEIHNIMNLGRCTDAGTMSLSESLKPVLARDNVCVIGATTNGEYNKFIRKDSAFIRRFNIVEISEPSVNDTFKILKECKRDYENHYNTFIGNDVLYYLICKSKFKKGHFPDKAFDALEAYLYEKSCIRGDK